MKKMVIALLSQKIKLFSLAEDLTTTMIKLGFTEVEKMIRKGDKVIMNGKYYVSEKNIDKEFIVTTEPTEVCGTLSVWLEEFRGCYAVDGLTKVGSLN